MKNRSVGSSRASRFAPDTALHLTGGSLKTRRQIFSLSQHFLYQPHYSKSGRKCQGLFFWFRDFFTAKNNTTTNPVHILTPSSTKIIGNNCIPKSTTSFIILFIVRQNVGMCRTYRNTYHFAKPSYINTNYNCSSHNALKATCIIVNSTRHCHIFCM